MEEGVVALSCRGPLGGGRGGAGDRSGGNISISPSHRGRNCSDWLDIFLCGEDNNERLKIKSNTY